MAVVGSGSSGATVGMGDSRLHEPEPKAVLFSEVKVRESKKKFYILVN